MNQAQKLLVRIGGLAELVAGSGGHYYADSQTAEKQHRRPLKGRGNYGVNIQAHFDQKRFAEMKDKKAARA